MAWVLLVISGLLETAWATALSRTEGFTRLWPSLIFIVTLVLSMAGLALALRTIPVGTGYAVWVGIGAVGTAIVGMAWMGEGVTVAKILCLLLLVSGIVGLKLLH
ncbi:DMT family transporter [Nocardiopsis sediminis]|uniref:DMT family transporter n=1 Tax=Nocardiopsis sediminis TaxID=1778267 RepID=A0ABV8FZ65_9ACTN